MIQHFILDGREAIPADLMTWANWLEDNRSTRIIQQDHIGDVMVSTVFIGLDTGNPFGDNGSPMIFETMIFGGKHDRDMDRYATYDDAEAGHAAMLERVRQSVE